MNFTGYRRDIDGLRTLAVVPVVLGHAGLGLFAGGFVGVDVFFVISGFLITGILVRELDEGRFSLIDFYERRARRILPALFVVLAACIVVFWFLLLPQHYEVMGKAGIASLLFSSNIYFFRVDSAYFGNGAAVQPLLHTWSLAVEEQFYIVFPVLLWLIAAWRRTSRTLLVAGLSLASFALVVWMVPRHPVAAFYLTPTRVWELGLGALLALGAFPALRHRLLAELVAAAGLIAIAWAVFTLDKTDPFPGLNALAPCLGAVAIIWAGQSQVTLTGRLLSTRGMVGIGLISYSLYLVHWPVLVAARILTSARGNLDPVTIVICLVLSLGLAWASWRFVERPFRAHEGGTRFGRRAIFALSGAGGAVLLGLFALLMVKDGFPARLPAGLEQAYTQATTRLDRMDRCHVGRIAAPRCPALGAALDGGPVDVLLIGDSHLQWGTLGFDDWLMARDLRGLAFHEAGCPPVLGVRRISGASDATCHPQTLELTDWIAEQGPVDMIVLHARWAMFAEGTRPPGEDGPLATLVPVDAAAPADGDNAELMRYGLDRMLAAIRPHADRIVLIGGIPEIGYHVPTFATRALMAGRPLPDTPDLADYRQRNARAQAILTEMAQKYGAIHVDPGPVFCTPDCRIAQDGQFLYFDDDHLSSFGSRLMIPQLLDLALAPET
ncbi:hypothetical protein AN189_16865 [Loktanella sp. 3ANDIMAR09]|uniref:acyltransferase family protein n=1 Tax=Loktanella sp. 3ANDIMAR09 TaxID=1225657 RepID=UPI0006FB23EB|nr:acyltransferase family protein [Loktanella sp. 3ANDIMAR09]KQI67152.1 hypothetical protein AN189_16865 [Loktanella sp. 3ANDIMAR09]